MTTSPCCWRRTVAAATLVLLALLVPGALAQEPDPIYNIPNPPNTGPGFELPPPPGPQPNGPDFIDPFPVVRIKGALTARGARLTRLSVRAPAGSDVSLKCKRKGCPKRSIARTTKLMRFKAFERSLRAGVRLIVRVTQPDKIGKYVKITIRRGRVPLRLDRCLMPGEKAPVKCPEA